MEEGSTHPLKGRPEIHTGLGKYESIQFGTKHNTAGKVEKLVFLHELLHSMGDCVTRSYLFRPKIHETCILAGEGRAELNGSSWTGNLVVQGGHNCCKNGIGLLGHLLQKLVTDNHFIGELGHGFRSGRDVVEEEVNGLVQRRSFEIGNIAESGKRRYG